MARKYKYAVIPSQGMYGSASRVEAVYRTDDLRRAKARAESLTRSYRDGMRRHGGTSGGYRVIKWGQAGSYIGLGHNADRIESV